MIGLFFFFFVNQLGVTEDTGQYANLGDPPAPVLVKLTHLISASTRVSTHVSILVIVRVCVCWRVCLEDNRTARG